VLSACLEIVMYCTCRRTREAQCSGRTPFWCIRTNDSLHQQTWRGSARLLLQRAWKYVCVVM